MAKLSGPRSKTQSPFIHRKISTLKVSFGISKELVRIFNKHRIEFAIIQKNFSLEDKRLVLRNLWIFAVLCILLIIRQKLALSSLI